MDNQMAVANRVNELQYRLPAGWETTNEVKETYINNGNRDSDIAFLEKYLPLAADKVENYVAVVAERLDIVIRESYLRLQNGIFHVLFLMDDETFHSPEKTAARMIAQHLLRPDEFDMHFTFSITTEYIKRGDVMPNTYEMRYSSGFDVNQHLY